MFVPSYTAKFFVHLVWVTPHKIFGARDAKQLQVISAGLANIREVGQLRGFSAINF